MVACWACGASPGLAALLPPILRESQRSDFIELCGRGKRKSVDLRYTQILVRVCEVLRMTRLAPDIIQAILDGRQPQHLNLHAMRGRQGEVPLDWDELRGMFGFGSARG